jgi:hypothetical protein
MYDFLKSISKIGEDQSSLVTLAAAMLPIIEHHWDWFNA